MEHNPVGFSLLFLPKKMMNRTAILFCLLILFIVKLNGQNPVAEEAQKRYREQSYLSAHLDYTYTFLNGTGGNERAEFYRDYIQDLANNGIAASGGVFGRHGVSVGAAYDLYLSKRFAFHSQLSYWQTGYRERLSASGETSAGNELNISREIKANLDYMHLLGGFKYYNDYGITLTLGGFVNYNIVDKVKHEETYNASGRFGTQDTTISSDLFFHEYYGENRTVFLTGGVFTIGYKWYDIEFDASIKVTGSILETTENKLFNVYQLGFRYLIPTRRED